MANFVGVCSWNLIKHGKKHLSRFSCWFKVDANIFLDAKAIPCPHGCSSNGHGDIWL